MPGSTNKVFTQRFVRIRFLAFRQLIREREIIFEPRCSAMNSLIKSILRTVVYFLDQTDRLTHEVRGRAYDAADRVSDIRDRAVDIYKGPNQTMRNVLMFAAGVGVGAGAAVLLAPASGEEIRGQIGQKVQDFGGRVKDRFSSAVGGATGTQG